MSFLQNLFGRGRLDGEKLAQSKNVQVHGQLDLLRQFTTARPLHDTSEQQRWSRALPRSYEDTIQLFEKQGWLARTATDRNTEHYQVTEVASPYVALYEERLAQERAAVMPKVRQALSERDTGEALSIRRTYEARFPLGQTDWTGPEPQLSHSALTRRILFLDHWLLDGLSIETAAWLKLYAAEEHLWGAYWQLPPAEIPQAVQAELTAIHPKEDKPEKDKTEISEIAYWRAYQLALYVDNQETWQRCKGGDHVRRIEIAGADDDDTCAHCREFLGQQYLVARVPELPHKECTSVRGCRCRYEPVLEMYDDLE